MNNVVVIANSRPHRYDRDIQISVIVRFMKPLLTTMATVFVITFLGVPKMSGGWFWDVGNGIGFAAFAGLLYLAITSNQRLDVRAHQVLAYVVLAIAVAHAFWFLLGDATVVEFIKIGAPDYMWLGIVSLLLFAILITTANLPDRLRVHTDYPSFRYWHRVLTVVVIAGSAYHIIGSNFYLGTWFQALLFALVSLVACLGRQNWARIGQIHIASPVKYFALSSALIIAFAWLRNLPA